MKNREHHKAMADAKANGEDDDDSLADLPVGDTIKQQVYAICKLLSTKYHKDKQQQQL